MFWSASIASHLLGDLEGGYVVDVRVIPSNFTAPY